MSTFIVTYDLSKPGQDYSDLHDHLKSYGSWAHIQQSVWAVKSTDSAAQVHKNVAQHLDSNDKLFVVKSGREAAWSNLTQTLTDWLKANL